jgi:hypothetical protein
MLITSDQVVQYEADLSLDGDGPIFGYGIYDLLVFEWVQYHEPAQLFKEEGHYDMFRDFIHSTRVSGLMYRGVQTDVSNILDYSCNVASWTEDVNVALNFTDPINPIVLRCQFDNVPGVVLGIGHEHEVIIGEMKYRQIGRTGQFVDVIPM